MSTVIDVFFDYQLSRCGRATTPEPVACGGFVNTTTLENTSVFAAVRALTPEITERASEAEEKLGVPPDIHQKLMQAGAFRMYLPKSVGGEGFTLAEGMRVIEEVSRGDGSTGWSVMVGAVWGILWTHFPAAFVNDVFAGGPDVLARGAVAPKGTAEVTDGGYRVKGRWPFGSGSYEHQWVWANCIVTENGIPRIGPAGIPEMRMVVLPAEQVEILDTWNVVGMRASASDDFVIDDKFVPAEHTGDIFAGTSSTFEGPLYKLPFRVSLSPTLSAIVLGIAAGAMENLKALAKVKRPSFNPGITIAEDPVVQYKIGQLEIRLAAARAFNYKEVEAIWGRVAAGAQLQPIEGVRVRAMVAHVHTECMAIVNEAFSLSGSNAIYNTSALQRRWRDVRTASQHLGASPETYGTLGALELDQDVPPMATD